MNYLEYVKKQNTPEKIKARHDKYLQRLKADEDYGRECKRLREEAIKAKLSRWAETTVSGKDIARFIADCADDSPDESYGTERENAQYVMDHFFEWLQGERNGD